MDNMERYGDYNEVDTPPTKSKVVKFLSFIVILGILVVAVTLGVRIYLYNTYPDTMQSIYVDGKLIDYFNETGGNVGAKTQNIRVPYDDPDRGSFFCDNLIVIDGMGRVQVTLRYNASTMEHIEAEYKMTDLDPTDTTLLTFKLYRNDSSTGEQFGDDDIVGTLVSADFETYAMYGYYRLVFDGIDLTSENSPGWLALAIFVNGSGSDKPFGTIPIYENNETNSRFTDYSVTAKDLEK